MIAALPRKPKPYFRPDPELPKHGVRVRPDGPGSYTIIVRDPYGKQRWVKIGSTAEMPIEAARAKARKVIERVEQGLEPFEPPPVKPDTVADVAEQWFKRHVEKKRLRTAPELKRILGKHILPIWRDRIFVDIKRKQIFDLLNVVEDKHGAHMADSVLAVLRSMAAYVQTSDDNYTPPFIRGMSRVPPEDRKRERVLTDTEITAVWRAAGDAGVYGAVIKMLLLTGQRRAKILRMKWSDISPDGVWTIHTEKREKPNATKLQLPEAARAVLRDLPRFAGNPRVFAHGTGDLSRLKRNFDKKCGVTGWQVARDVRRTARTLMSRAGVRRDIGERVLGHLQGNVVERIYDKHDYADEKADALQRLAAIISIIVAGKPTDDPAALRAEIDGMVAAPSKVVKLPRSRRVAS